MPPSAIVDRHGVPFSNQSPYEGAASGPRTRYWQAGSGGPNRVLQHSLSTLRNRSRAAQRDNPWLANAVHKLVTHEVGTGVTLRSGVKDNALRETIDTLWQASSKQLDPEGLLSFGALQAQAVRARRVAGEVFIRKRPRRLNADLAVPLQLQVLEAEFVPETLDYDRANGNRVRAGIEFNRHGQRTAYWMHREHPQDDHPDLGRLVRVPARDVIHHYTPIRPGQRRGIPDVAQALLSAHTFDQYEDAELVRKQTRAPITGVLTRPEPYDEDFAFDPYSGDAIQGVPSLTDVPPGNILSALPGESLTLFDSDKTGEGFAVYARSVLLKIAAGWGIPYELMTGDWEKVNDRLVRAILNDFQRAIEAAQEHLLIHQVCTQTWHWWLDAAVWSGRLSIPGYAHNKAQYQALQAHAQGWRYIHPEQDINAKIKAVQHGFTSRQQIIEEQPGLTMTEIDQQRAQDDFQPDA